MRTRYDHAVWNVMGLFSFPRLSLSILRFVSLSLSVCFFGRHTQRSLSPQAFLAELMLVCGLVECLPLRRQVPVASWIRGEDLLSLDVGALS